MFKSCLKTAFRNLAHHRGYSMINIGGFAIGIACCVLIFLWVQDELSFDRFHENLESLQRVVQEVSFSDGTILRTARTPYPMGPALVTDQPEIIRFTRLTPFLRILIEHEDKAFYESDFAFADPSLLEMFSFPLLKGDPNTALSETNSVLISEDMAKKYFGSEDPMGKTLTMDNQTDFQVSGVFENIPRVQGKLARFGPEIDHLAHELLGCGGQFPPAELFQEPCVFDVPVDVARSRQAAENAGRIG